MSYQIKSTPYFQRMLKKSKQNGQLQMLKEEYDRMDAFNEFKIEKRMREVRLSKLKREIGEIMEYSSKRRRLDSKANAKDEETRHIENIKNSRTLGKYYSELNSRDVQYATGKKPKPKMVPPRTESHLSKRIKYGNKISDWNLEKMKHREKYKVNTRRRKNLFQIENRKSVTKMASTSMANGRTCPCIGLQVNRNGIIEKSILTISENLQFIDLESIDTTHFENTRKMNSILSCSSKIDLNREGNNWYTTSHISSQAITHLDQPVDQDSEISSSTSNSFFKQIHACSSFSKEPSLESDISQSCRASKEDKQEDISEKRQQLYAKGGLNNERLSNNEYSFKTMDDQDLEYSTSTSSTSNEILKPVHAHLNLYVEPIPEACLTVCKEEGNLTSVDVLRQIFRH